MRKDFLTAIIALMAGAYLSGCLVVGNKDVTMRADEERLMVEFESDEAAALFHDCRKSIKCSNKESSEQLVIPFICATNTSKKMSVNARYNDEVHQCDSDGDGFISLAEAKLYNENCP